MWTFRTRVGERVCYMDTDSVIYQTHDHEDPNTVQTGPYFGDLTDEIPHGVHMTEFVSAGPKNYGYATSDGKSTVKVRGITLTTRASERLNMTAMQTTIHQVVNDFVTGEHSAKEAAEQHSIAIPFPHSIVREGKRKERKDLTLTMALQQKLAAFLETRDLK